MKNVINILVAIVLISLLSCNDHNLQDSSLSDNFSVSHNTRGILSEELEQIGFIHNCELQNVYNEIKSYDTISYMQGVNVISKNIISKTNSEEYSMAMRIVNKSMNIQKNIKFPFIARLPICLS